MFLYSLPHNKSISKCFLLCVKEFCAFLPVPAYAHFVVYVLALSIPLFRFALLVSNVLFATMFYLSFSLSLSAFLSTALSVCLVPYQSPLHPFPSLLLNCTNRISHPGPVPLPHTIFIWLGVWFTVCSFSELPIPPPSNIVLSLLCSWLTLPYTRALYVVLPHPASQDM